MLNRIKRLFEFAQEDEEERLDVPRPYVIMLDQSEGWREDILKKAGKIFGVFLVDKANKDFEYHLMWMYNEVEKFDNFHIDSDDKKYSLKDEQLLNNIENENGAGDNGMDDPDIYIRSFDEIEIVKQHRVTASEMESATHDDYDEIIDNCISNKEYYKKELMDELYGYFRSNHVF